MKKKLTRKHILIASIVVVAVLVLVIIGVVIYAKNFLSAETSIRDDWSVKTGDLLLTDEELNISIFEDSVESSINII